MLCRHRISQQGDGGSDVVFFTGPDESPKLTSGRLTVQQVRTSPKGYAEQLRAVLVQADRGDRLIALEPFTAVPHGGYQILWEHGQHGARLRSICTVVVDEKSTAVLLLKSSAQAFAHAEHGRKLTELAQSLTPRDRTALAPEKAPQNQGSAP